MTRLMTDAEILGFKLRHIANYLFQQIPYGEGRFVADSVLGICLVFAKTDGAVLFIVTDLQTDPTTGDPSQIQYVMREILKSIGQNLPSPDKLITAVIVIGIVIVAIFIFQNVKK